MRHDSLKVLWQCFGKVFDKIPGTSGYLDDELVTYWRSDDALLWCWRTQGE